MPTNKYSEWAKKSWRTRKIPMPAKFWLKVRISPWKSCWEYTGKLGHYGHGIFKLGQKRFQAHRVAWELVNGLIPNGKFICHKCDNPPCCNPDHLYVGDAKTNGRDSSIRNRYPDRKGEKHSLAVLNNANVIKIRNEFNPRIVTRKMLAERYSVSISTIKDVLSRRHWSHVTA